MSKKAPKPQVTVEDMFNAIIAKQKELETAIGQDREHLNQLTGTVNQLTSAISTAKSAKPAKTGAGDKFGFLADMIGQGIQAFIKNPDKFLGSTPEPPKDTLVEKHKDLIDKMVKTQLENAIETSNLTVQKLKKDVERAGRTGWDVI